MDKNAIKKFAIWARRELISRVSQRAARYGITEKDPIDGQLQAVHGHVFTQEEQAQRRALIEHIRKQGYKQVMEEVAYTWFNRFIALRFMEVNGYLPSYIRVFSDENNAFNPQILAEALHVDLVGLDKEKLYAFEEKNDKEGLFKYLIITQCNDLYRMLPGMFQRLADYTELLFPENLLREGSVIEQMVTAIPEEDWKDAVQIIGWLYQYYNAEPKDEVFAALKKNVKISKEKIPAATQLFTPDWIVRYMVENSLGRLWVEGHPNEELKKNWKYYLEEAQQEPEVEKQLAEIRAEYTKIDPASILCIDPCMGSGHILVYMFDVLMQIYLSYGYTTNEAVESIIRNNLWGMDIDDRAAQLAYFAVMMKAQQHDRRWLAKLVKKPVQPNVFALQDSGDWEAFEPRMRKAFAHHPSIYEEACVKTAKALYETFTDAKEYGSIIQPDIQLEDLNMLEKTLTDMGGQANLMDMAVQADAKELLETLKPLIRQCSGLVQKYHVVVTNPPYMGTKGMSEILSQFIKSRYPNSKGDLFSVFIEKCMRSTCMTGLFSMITQRTWLFIGTFEKLRQSIVNNTHIISTIELGAGAFDDVAGEVVQSVAFTISNKHLNKYASLYYDLSLHSEKHLEKVKPQMVFADRFEDLPFYTFAMKLSPQALNAYDSKKSLGMLAQPKKGLISSDNNRFFRLWFEVANKRIQYALENITDQDPQTRWLPHNKGGSFRRWYGNQEYLINWEANGRDVKKYASDLYGSYSRQIMNEKYYLKESLSWSYISGEKIGIRYYPKGFVFDSAGPSIFISDEATRSWVHGFLSSCVAQYFIRALNPTINLLATDIANLPVIQNAKMDDAQLYSITKQNIRISKVDWDSFETSWDFKEHPFAWHSHGLWDGTRRAANMDYYDKFPHASCPLEICWLLWNDECEERFEKLKANEEELNRIFINIYGLQDELTPEVEDKDVTVRKADLGRDMRSFISYAVGCMFGRYSLDQPGLILAGQDFKEKFSYASVPVAGTGFAGSSSFETVQGDCYLIRGQNDLVRCSFAPDADGIIPISDDEYFEDDVVGRFVIWLKTVFGEDSLEANLKFVADALGGKGAPRDVLRQYFLNDFYKDHLKVYQKRPIYWLFDSGKKNGFKCLIYMHRYQPDTIARIRTDYVHETQARYRNAIEIIERQSANASAGEKVKLGKRLEALRAQAEEVRVFEEKIHHLADQMIAIDLDDGVKVNYAKFADVLAPIK